MTQTPRAGFTLIELLAVIVLVALLAALLVPAAGKVRENSLNSACQSNLRQLGIAFQMYAGDNNGALPYLQGSTSTTWHADIAPYIGLTATQLFDERAKRPLGPLACPASKNVTRSGNYSDYGMNMVVSDRSGSVSRTTSSFGVPTPSKVLLLADAVNCNRRLGIYDPNCGLEARHSGGTVNVLWADGHTSSEKLSTLTTNIQGDKRYQAPWGWEGWTAP